MFNTNSKYQENGIIIRFTQSHEQVIGNVRRVIGLLKAKYLIPVIDELDLQANPRESKTGRITNAIQDSIMTNSELFPVETKGILLAATDYDALDRKRYRIRIQDPSIEGILDGGHNTLAIGLYILQIALDYAEKTLPKGSRNWAQFKKDWAEYRPYIENYLEAAREAALQENEDFDNKLDFYIPVELLLPASEECANEFSNELFVIGTARNNNAQLTDSTKANQQGYFEELQSLMEKHNPELASIIEWKTNSGGQVKVEDLVALAWIPLSLLPPVKDAAKRKVEAPAPANLYSGKGACMKAFERLMSSDEVTSQTSADYKRELRNRGVVTAFKVAVELPDLYDYIEENLSIAYNNNGGKFGRIGAVKKMNDKRRKKLSHFNRKEIDTLSPDGFVAPLVYGLKELMECIEEDGQYVVRWKCDPREFLQENFVKIVKKYMLFVPTNEYDPQKVGKSAASYEFVRDWYQMNL